MVSEARDGVRQEKSHERKMTMPSQRGMEHNGGFKLLLIACRRRSMVARSRRRRETRGYSNDCSMRVR